MTFKSLRLQCIASGDSYYSYSGPKVPQDRKVPCPMCGKIVKLRAHQPGFPRFIPTHNKQPSEISDAGALAAAIEKSQLKGTV